MSTDSPIHISCLTLQRVIDDKNVLEKMLSDDRMSAAVETCIPTAVYNLLQVHAEREGMNVQIPDARTLMSYLQILWGMDDVHTMLIHAQHNGLTYMVPYQMARDDVRCSPMHHKSLHELHSQEQLYLKWLLEYRLDPAISRFLTERCLTSNDIKMEIKKRRKQKKKTVVQMQTDDAELLRE